MAWRRQGGGDAAVKRSAVAAARGVRRDRILARVSDGRDRMHHGQARTSAEADGGRMVAWPHAVERILAAAWRGRAVGEGVVVVGVTGAVAAGKSRLAAAIVERAPLVAGVEARIVSTDHYLPDYDATPEHLRDLPESSDLARLAADLDDLRAGRVATVPRWTFETHRREGETRLAPAPLVVVEGLHALHETARARIDLSVFVEAPREVRWNRAVARESAGERPWPLEYLAHFFDTVAEPTYARHAERYRRGADLVVVNDGSA